MSEAGVLALTVGGTALEFHLACSPIKPLLTLGHLFIELFPILNFPYYTISKLQKQPRRRNKFNK